MVGDLYHQLGNNTLTTIVINKPFRLKAGQVGETCEISPVEVGEL